MAIDTENEKEKRLMQKIARVLDEARASNATHIRKLKDLSALRSSSPIRFFPAFSKTLTPLFNFSRRTASTERTVRFAAVFAATPDAKNASVSDTFLEAFLRFLLVAASAANKTARFRACQIISEIIMRLPDNAEVSNEIWDEVIECMKLRVADKVPVIRTFAVRSLSRFVNDSENGDILDLLLDAIPLEQNAEVRKTIILALPPSNATSAEIINCTLDASESVRKAVYCVLASKFPLQSLSIKLRTIILHRGFADRSAAVKKECMKLLKDDWLVRYCNGDPIELLKYLDVETYESVAESVMEALLKSGVVKVQDSHSIRQYIPCSNDTIEGNCTSSIQLMEAEVALYWRTFCRHLQTEAQAKCCDAAATMGTEAAVYASEATDSNDLLERILPSTVSEYVDLVKAHLLAGPNYRFASRQLLLLGAMLDFSDVTNRKIGGSFVQELMQRLLEHEVDENGNKVVIGDGINVGGERDWADAVSQLARRVHAASGEFEEVVLGFLQELARPCRERTADFMQWMHCLAVTGLLLENTKSFRWMQGKSIEPDGLLHSLLLPGAKHVHFDVQRVATRCLGLFGLLQRKPSDELVKQLRLSFVKGPSQISSMACKALFDLALWHGPQEVNKAMGQSLSSHLRDHATVPCPIEVPHANGDMDFELLDLLFTGFEKSDWGISADADENEAVQAVLGEGFAKILLLSENYPSIPASSHLLLLAKIIDLYFSDETKELQRLRQCLSVFFEHYPSLSITHKRCLSKAFILVMRSIWPGINGNAGGSPLMISIMRKRAVQASRFMMQMMQAPLYAKETETTDEYGGKDFPETVDGSVHPLHDFENGEEGLAIRIAAEVINCPDKKKAAEKSYVVALCKILVLLHFRVSEQKAIKLMRRLLNRVTDSIPAEKELVKELKRMAERLKAVDEHPDQDLSLDEVNDILGKLELDLNVDLDGSTEIPPTPAPRSGRTTRPRRRVRHEESSSDDETSPTSVVPINPGLMSTRSQRASKTAALSKMTANRSVKFSDDIDEEDKGSEVTSEEDSGESDQSSE
ncbi:Condensin complex subunit 3 like [Actinidia chinensis var. chinensis]|uniref:Condensin complex subunit 3 like n=1 Tax=Actinidia chinensis var. chinensis TaxID=1590841 RepID=A0A2R6RDZ3_ACTCC|nr:Condensin complex subunit 3 like [Actinidia chinensis var. chinensis]